MFANTAGSRTVDAGLPRTDDRALFRRVDALDSGSRRKTQSPPSIPYRWERYTKAYLALPRVWWSWRLLKMENGPTGPFTEICKERIVPPLRSALHQANLVSGGLDAQLNSMGRFWAFYVGAVAEQAARRGLKVKNTGLNSGGGWFTSELVSHANSIGILVWCDPRLVLEGFLYSDNVEPHGSTLVHGCERLSLKSSIITTTYEYGLHAEERSVNTTDGYY